MSDYHLTPEQLLASDPAHSVWVSANAGSGKTHVLVDRVVRLLLSGADPAAILCITYTKAAAAEMSKRLFAMLGSWIGMSNEKLQQALSALGEDGHDAHMRARARRLFTKALETPGGLKIQTIHAFCERLLHLFPIEAGMAPGFRVMDEQQASDLREAATRTVLGQAREQLAFDRLADRLNSEQFDFLIRAFLDQLRGFGDRISELERKDYEAVLRYELQLGAATRDDVWQALQSVDQEAYLRHAKVLQPYGKHYELTPADKLMEIARADAPLEPLLDYFTSSERKAMRSVSRLFKVSVTSTHPDTHKFLLAEQQRVFGLFQQLNTHETILASGDAFILTKAIWSRIDDEKRRLGVCDFSDLIGKATQLLVDSPARHWVLNKLDPKLAHILLDEAQDTGPAQWRIIAALAEEFFAGQGRHEGPKRTLFVVGDQKQSIYSFQGADAVAFTKSRLGFAGRDAGLQKPVELAISYRSLQNILQAVDTVFPTPALSHIGVDATSERPHTAHRNQWPGRVELWPLVEEDDAADPDAWSKPVDRPPKSSPQRKLARELAERIQAWLSPKHPRFLEPRQRPVEPGDILILFQTRSTLYRMVLAELRRCGVPVAGADRLHLLESLVVQDLLMLLHWLGLPADDHALAVVLKGPLVPEPVSEKQLFELCHPRTGRLIDAVTGANAEYLGALLQETPKLGPFDILAQVLMTRRPSIVARLGSEALEASDALLDLAAQYEREHGRSLFGFVQWFKATQSVLKRDLEHAEGEVRLMTVHGAKGLQANIVIIADATRVTEGAASMPDVITVPEGAEGAGLPVWKLSGLGDVNEALKSWAANTVAAEQHERNRLLYVAMTRAADELYIAGAKGKDAVPRESWWARVTGALGDAPWRLGPDDVIITPPKPDPPPNRPSPDLTKLGPLPTIAIDTSALRPSHSKSDAASAGFRRGRALHRLYQIMADLGPQLAVSKGLAMAAHLGLIASDYETARRLFDRADLQSFLGPESQGEKEIAGILPNGLKVLGRADRITITGKGVWLLDFKTDQFVPETMNAAHDYARQMALYWALLRQAYPDRAVTAALLWTELGKLELLPDPLLAAALQEVEAPVT